MRRSIYAALAVVALAGACSDDSATAPSSAATSGTPAATAPTVPAAPTPPTSGPAPAPNGLAAGWSVAAALAEVPDTGGPFELYTADLAAIGELIGAERPDVSAGPEAVVDEWVLPLTFTALDVEYRELPVWVYIPAPVLPATVLDVDRFDELLGWSIVDVDAFVHYQPEPPEALSVVAGDIAADALSGLPEVADHVVTTRDGEELAPDLGGDTVVDQLGRPVRLTRDGDRIALSLTSALVEAWRDGGTAMLADDAQLAAVATALDAAGVYHAQVFRHDFTFDPLSVAGAGASPDAVAEVEAAFADDGVATPFGAVGIGWTVADGSPRVVIAFATAGAAQAADLAEQLGPVFATGTSLLTGAPLTELLGADTFEITTAGDAVTVAYEPIGRPWSTPIDMVVRRDLPFLHR